MKKESGSRSCSTPIAVVGQRAVIKKDDRGGNCQSNGVPWKENEFERADKNDQSRLGDYGNREWCGSTKQVPLRGIERLWCCWCCGKESHASSEKERSSSRQLLDCGI